MKSCHITYSGLVKAPAQEVYTILADYRHGHPRILPKPYFNVNAALATL